MVMEGMKLLKYIVLMISLFMFFFQLQAFFAKLIDPPIIGKKKDLGASHFSETNILKVHRNIKMMIKNNKPFSKFLRVNEDKE